MNFLSRIGAPAVELISGSTRLVMRVLRLHAPEAPPVTEEEIKVMMEQGTEAGVFEEAEHDIVKIIFKLGDRAVSALMKSRRDVVWLDVEDPFVENQKKLASSLYSRFPVGQGSLDNVLGIVQTKDLLTRCLAGSKVDLRENLRPPLFVPEALPALRLLELEGPRGIGALPHRQLEGAISGADRQRRRVGCRPDDRPIGRPDRQPDAMARQEAVAAVVQLDADVVVATGLKRLWALVAVSVSEVQHLIRDAGRAAVGCHIRESRG